MKLNLIAIITFMAGFAIMSFSEKINNIDGIDAWWPVVLGCITMTGSLTYMHAAYDAGVKIKGIHWRRMLYRPVALLVITWAVLYYANLDFLTVRELSLFNRQFTVPITYFIYVSLFFVNGFTFGILFDPIRNIKAGQDWEYIGNEAWYDRADRKININFIILEIAGLALSIAIFFISTKHL